MRTKMTVFLGVVAVIAGTWLGLEICGGASGDPVGVAGLTNTDIGDLGDTRGEFYVSPRVMVPGEVNRHQEQAGALDEVSTMMVGRESDLSKSESEFVNIPKHDHDHDDVVLPEKFVGISTDAWVALLPKEQGERLQRYRNDLASFDPDRQRFMCWAPGTPSEIVMGYRRAEKEGGLDKGEVQIKATQFLSPERWLETATNPSGSSSQGAPITVTWSIAPDGTRIPGDSGALGPSEFRTWMQQIYGGSATDDPTTQGWFPLMEEAFAHLGDQSGLTFVYEARDTGTSFSRGNGGILGTRGDIRIGARDIDGNSGTLAFAYSPGYGDIVMDSTDNFFNNTTSNSRRFVNVLTHEIGHAIGLGHVCPIRETKLMEPYVTENFRGAQFDEFQSIQRQYGDALEVHGGFTNNDLVARAKDLQLTPNISYSKQWLSIDGITDSDWFSFDCPANARLTVRVVPASGSYLEGPQDFSCSGGSLYNPAINQDLVLQVFRNSGTLLLNTRDATSLGGTEVLAGMQLLPAGNYQIKVSGKSASSAQLYRLEILLETAPSGVDLQVVKTRLFDESNVGRNGNVDPDETVVLGITLVNNGTDAAQLVSGELTGPAGFIDFGGQQTVETISSGLQSEMFFTVSAQGECGDPVNMILELQSNGGTATHPIGVVMGSAGGPKVEGFDDSSSLPSGWVVSKTGKVVDWAVVSSRTNSAPNSAFAAGSTKRGLSNLDSEPLGIGPGGGTLTFRHWHDLQLAFDGGQLQASRNDGAWFDLPGSAAVVIEGGYNETIMNYGGSDIDGQMAWSGNSSGFKTTTIRIPSAWAGDEIRFRWRMAHDTSRASTGWWVDTVNFDTDLLDCDPYLPRISLSLESGNLSERSSVDPLKLTLSTVLPLRYPVTVPLTLSGTAGADDLTATPFAELGIGDTESVFELAAKLDRLDEGSESLTLMRPTSSPSYLLDGPTSFTVSVEDSEYAVWAGSTFSPGVPMTGPDEDADDDGWSNVSEYLSGSDPNDPDSLPQTQLVVTGSTLEIQTGSADVDRDDAEIFGETSIDLQDWTREDVGKTLNGFEVSRDDPARFLRLVYQFLDVVEEPEIP